MDYREAHKVSGEEINEKSIFKDDVNKSGECHMVVGNDVGWFGNRSNNEIDVRYIGLKLSYSLWLLLADYDMHRPRK